MVVEGHHQVIDVDMEEEVVMVEQAGVVLASHAILNFEVRLDIMASHWVMQVVLILINNVLMNLYHHVYVVS